MMRILLPTAALPLAMAFLASPAHAAAHLECVDSGYVGADKAAVDRFFKVFTVATMNEAMNDGALGTAIGNRAVACSEQNGWSADALKQSVFYRTASLLLQALERKSPLSAVDLSRLKAAFANADQARLRGALGPRIEAELSGQSVPQTREEDEIYLGAIILGAGIPTSEAALNFAGAWIGAKTMRDIAAERFAAQ